MLINVVKVVILSMTHMRNYVLSNKVKNINFKL